VRCGFASSARISFVKTIEFQSTADAAKEGMPKTYSASRRYWITP
jgi:hypothetical protein